MEDIGDGGGGGEEAEGKREEEVGRWWGAIQASVSRAPHNCEYLVNIVAFDGGVEHGVEVVQQTDDLHGCAQRRDGGEAHDVAEVDGDLGERLRLHVAAHLQTLRHRPATRSQSASQSASQSVSQSVSQPASQSVSQYVSQPVSQSVS